MTDRPTSYAIKATIADPAATRFTFPRHKTMYGGKRIAVGDRIYLFDRADGRGLFARGTVADASALARDPALARQTPRVSVVIDQIEWSSRQLGRTDLRPARERDDRPVETELDFKLYRQATDKIVGLTPATARFLDGLF